MAMVRIVYATINYAVLLVCKNYLFVIIMQIYCYVCTYTEYVHIKIQRLHEMKAWLDTSGNKMIK